MSSWALISSAAGAGAELEQPGVLRKFLPGKKMARVLFGSLSTEPDKELWIAAETAGADLIANRGALPRLLYERLKLYSREVCWV
ncbi:MAG: hypothetical protein Ct9H300mP28_02670 [Pseudomonadota bacterium]|nr:MAG: hypothetical protein Ct9H300mP28_02670 [Pseudomonadota bacterium]